MIQDGPVNSDWLSWGALVQKEVDPGCFKEEQIFMMMTLLHQLKSLKAALLERQEKPRLTGWARTVSEVDLEPVCMQMSWFCDNVKWLHLNLSCH